jgi:hypothetical protein
MSGDGYPARVFRRLKNGVTITVHYYAQGNKDYHAERNGERIGLWHTEGHPDRGGMNYSYGEIERLGITNPTFHNFREWLKEVETE